MNTPDQTVSEEAMLSLFSGGSAELMANPFPLFAQMRSTGAVIPIPFPMAGTDHQAWAVTRMEEAVQVLKDHAHFTVDRSSIGDKSLAGAAGRGHSLYNAAGAHAPPAPLRSP